MDERSGPDESHVQDAPLETGDAAAGSADSRPLHPPAETGAAAGSAERPPLDVPPETDEVAGSADRPPQDAPPAIAVPVGPEAVPSRATASPETEQPPDGDDTEPPDRRGVWIWVGAVLAAITAVAVAVVVRGTGSPANPASLTSPVAANPSASPPIPARLRRPLRFPEVARGGRCPTTKGTPVANAAFGGVSFGGGVVRLVIGNEGDLARGVVDLDFAGNGWWSINTLWYSSRSYQGPFLIRARRLDGPGAAQAGGAATAGVLFVPRGHTLNTYGGVRTAPSSTLVRAAGCYGWQIDGSNFTDLVVVDALRP